MTTIPRHLIALAAAGIGVVSLTGCGNGLSGSASAHVRSTDSTASATSSPTASSTPTSTTSSHTTSTSTSHPTSSSTSSSSHSGPSACTLAGLKVGEQDSEGGAGAGSNYILLTFTNTSRATCTLEGHPGVSFVGKHDGTQIGKPAVRNGSLRPVTLSPGERTTAVLQIANAANYPVSSCAPTTSDGFRVYPPGSTGSVFVPFTTQVCQGSTSGSPQLSVSAVGTSA